MPAGRRFLGRVPQLTRRPWENVAQELEEFLRKLWDSEADGSSAGYSSEVPETVEAGDIGSAGTEASGWSAADHEHPVSTAAPVDFINSAPEEGTATGLARSDHKHRRDVWVEESGVDQGVVNALNFMGPEIEVETESNLTGSLLTGLYGYWSLDEASGTRFRNLGTGPDLSEQISAVGSATGKFGLAAASAEAGTYGLGGAVSPALGLGAGLTWSFWFWWDAWTLGNPQSLFLLDNGVGTGDLVNPFFGAYRWYGSDALAMHFTWGGGASFIRQIPPGLDQGQWHLVVVTYDPATGNMVMRWDEGCLASASFSTSPPYTKLLATVPPASLAAANACTFTRIQCLRRYNGNFVNLEGRMDSMAVWTKVLTDLEVEQLWISSRANVSLGSVVADEAMIMAIIFGGK